MLDSCVYQLAKGSLIEEVEMLRGPLQVSEKEFLKKMLERWLLAGALLESGEDPPPSPSAPTDPSDSRLVTKTIPTRPEISELRTQNLQNLVRDS